MTMKNKAGRLGKSDLSGIIAAAADAAKSRIEQIDASNLEMVSGGVLGDPSDEGDDWATEGAIMPIPDPFEDLFGTANTLGL